MKSFTRVLAVSMTSAAALLVSQAAFAEETVCTGQIGAVSLDNIAVPDGATCYLNGTRANGTLKVGTGATLYAHSVTINGNVQAEGAESVQMGGRSFVGGSVQIVQGEGASITRTTVNGDLFFAQNEAAIRANGNRIGGNLQAFENTGGTSFSNNFIKGNMQCKENAPAPVGSGNQASSKEDQCARL